MAEACKNKKTRNLSQRLAVSTHTVAACPATAVVPLPDNQQIS